MKLFRVRVSYEIVVYASNESVALVEAMECIPQEQASSFGPATEIKRMIEVPATFLDRTPVNRGLNETATCAELTRDL